MTKDWCSSSPSCWEQTLEIWSQRYMVSPKMVFPHLPHIFTVWQKSKPLPSAPSSAACRCRACHVWDSCWKNWETDHGQQGLAGWRQLVMRHNGLGAPETFLQLEEQTLLTADLKAEHQVRTGLPTYTWERMKKPLLVSRSKEHKCTLPSNNCRKDILHSPVQECNWFFQREDSNKTWSKFTMPIWR